VRAYCPGAQVETRYKALVTHDATAGATDDVNAALSLSLSLSLSRVRARDKSHY